MRNFPGGRMPHQVQVDTGHMCDASHKPQIADPAPLDDPNISHRDTVSNLINRQRLPGEYYCLRT